MKQPTVHLATSDPSRTYCKLVGFLTTSENITEVTCSRCIKRYAAERNVISKKEQRVNLIADLISAGFRAEHSGDELWLRSGRAVVSVRENYPLRFHIVGLEESDLDLLIQLRDLINKEE